MKSKSIKIDTNGKELSEDPHNNSNMNIHTIKQNNDIELPVNNNVDMNERQAEAGVILGQNCIQFLDTAPNDFFLPLFLIKSSINITWILGSLKSEVPFYSFFNQKLLFYISAGCFLQSLK